MNTGSSLLHTRAKVSTLISNEIINSKELSFEAIMVLIWMLSRVDGCVYSTEYIQAFIFAQEVKPKDETEKQKKVRVDAKLAKTQKIIEELRDAKYIFLEQHKDGRTCWHVFEDPKTYELWMHKYLTKARQLKIKKTTKRVKK